MHVTNRCYEVSPSNQGQVGGWWEMESRTWWTVEPRPGRLRHRLLNRRENMENMRMFHLTERLQVNYIYKTFLQDADFPQEGALQAPSNPSLPLMFCCDCCDECKSYSCWFFLCNFCHVIISASAPAGILIPESTQTAPAAAHFSVITERMSHYIRKHSTGLWLQAVSAYSMKMFAIHYI